MAETRVQLSSVAFKVGDYLTGTQYRILDKEDRPEGEEARPIHRGGSALVFRVDFKGLMRAAKILAPDDLLGQPPGSDAAVNWKRFVETFKQEIQLLSSITHTNIAKLFDFGQLDMSSPHPYPYYIMEYVEGTHFLEAAAGFRSAREFFGAIDSLLGAIEYLHGKHVLHADVKSENIKIRPDGHLVLLDLGVARVIPDSGTSGLTFFFSTKGITRDRHDKFRKHQVPLDFLREIFPDHDLYAVGILLKAVLALPEMKVILREEIGKSSFDSLDLLVGRLWGPEERQIGSVAVLRETFHRLDPRFMSPMGVPELGLAVDVQRTIALAETRVPLSERVFRIIDNPLLQRLRVLNQLSFVYLIAPGAKHSRFSTGVYRYHLVREYLAHLLEVPGFRLLVEPSDIEAALIHGLLKDIGHYALGHVFEDFQDDLKMSAGVIPDDTLLLYFLSDRDSWPAEKQQTVALLGDILPDPTRKAAEELRIELQKHFRPDTPRLLGQLLERDRAKLPSDRYHAARLVILRGLLDCPIDAGKVAYLKLDSQYSGAEYGRGIDLDSLLSQLTMPDDGLLDQSNGAALAIRQDGLAAAESVILARYWMIQRVYWHHSNRAVMSMIRFVVEGLIRAGLFEFSAYLRENWMKSHEHAVRYLCGLWNGGKTVEQKLDAPVWNPLESLVNGERAIYSKLLSLNRRYGDDENLIGRLSYAARESIWQMQVDLAKKLATLLNEDVPLGAVLVDVPTARREDQGGKLWVTWSRPGKEPQDVFAASPILKEFTTEFEQHAKRGFVFVSPRLREWISSKNQWKEAQEIARDVLGGKRTGGSGT